MKKGNDINPNWEQEKDAVDYLAQRWNCENTYLGKNVFGRIDGMLHRDNELKALYEVKCRTQGYSWFKEYKSTMFSYNRIQIGSELSRLHKVRFFVIIETCDKHLIVFQITNEEGKIVCPMNIRFKDAEKTHTFEKQESVNAYLSMENNKYCWIYKRKDSL